ARDQDVGDGRRALRRVEVGDVGREVHAVLAVVRLRIANQILAVLALEDADPEREDGSAGQRVPYRPRPLPFLHVHAGLRPRPACPSAQACTSLCRSVSSTCSTSEPGSTRCLPTSKIRTESTKPLPFAADDPTSTFWQRAIFPTLETHAASCGSHRAVESPS